MSPEETEVLVDITQDLRRFESLKKDIVWRISPP